MPFARIDLIKDTSPEYRAAFADIVYRGIVDVIEAPDGDRFVVAGDHTAGNLTHKKTCFWISPVAASRILLASL